MIRGDAAARPTATLSGQAFAEVALLLFGIGLALVVDQWRDRARDPAIERSYLSAIYGRESEATWIHPGMPTFPAYAKNPRVSRPDMSSDA